MDLINLSGIGINTQSDMKGTLYVVATPIGNLGDISVRAIETLKQVDLIIAEDTRHSEKLLKHFLIATPLTSFHAHNENQKTDIFIEKLLQKKSLALISDAGTPLISDPGFPLVHKAQKLKIPVVPIPGACALIVALSVSGLPSHRFSFEGFLPVKAKACTEALQALIRDPRTLIFYEAPHRIIKTLTIMQTIFGEERQVSVARELTKHFESIQTDSFTNILKHLQAFPETQQGEFVILIEGYKESAGRQESVTISLETLLQSLLTEMPLKKAVKIAEKITGGRKNEFYKMGLDFKLRSD